VVPIYPLNKLTAASKRAEESIKKLKEVADAVIIVDNNLKRGKSRPMLDVFRHVNVMVSELVVILISSISGLGAMNLSKDEIHHFLYGDKYLILTGNNGPDLKVLSKSTLNETENYVDAGDVEKCLVLTSTPVEMGISEMRDMNGEIEKGLNPDAIKWINMVSPGENSFLLVSAVKELPLVQGVKMPGTIISDGEESEEDAPEKVVVEGDGSEQEVVEEKAPVGNQKEGEDPKEMPKVGGMLFGDSKAEEKWGEIEEGVEPRESKESSGVKEGEEEVEEDQEGGEEESENEEDMAIPESEASLVGIQETKTPEAAGGQAEEDYSPILESIEAEGSLSKSQALIGLSGEEKGEASEEEEDQEVPEPVAEEEGEVGVDEELDEKDEERRSQEEEDIDDIISELVGFPNFKKKGQKKLDDYSDDYGIGYI
jgi:hypothetical protein